MTTPMRPGKDTIHANLRKRVALGYFTANLALAFKTTELAALERKERTGKR